MKFKYLQAIMAGLIFAVSGFSNAALITHSDYTEDTTNKLAFLDFGLIDSENYAQLDVTKKYGGYEWHLATVDQFTTFITEITGVAFPSWSGTDLTDFNMKQGPLEAVLDIIAGQHNSDNPFYLKEAYGFIYTKGGGIIQISKPTAR